MDIRGSIEKVTASPARVSYLFITGVLIVTGWLHLGAPLVAALFAYLALTKLHFFKRRGKILAVILFVILLAGVGYTVGYVVNQAVRALPEIAEKAIPSVIQWAKQHEIELPFTDFDSLKDLAMDTVKSQVYYLGGVAKFARGATTGFVLAIIGFVIAIGIFLQPRFDLDGGKLGAPNNLYSLCCEAIARRFETFYASFATVMGAQIVISAINTVLTGVFVLTTQLPHAALIIGATFLCGLLPVVGNLISNTIIVGVGITVSPKMAAISLTYLVVIHKLEYFLNSKIVGDRIRNPFWLTLLALVVGEKLMGIPGMILAPVVLNYVRMESSRIEVKSELTVTDDGRAKAPEAIPESR